MPKHIARKRVEFGGNSAASNFTAASPASSCARLSPCRSSAQARPATPCGESPNCETQVCPKRPAMCAQMYSLRDRLELGVDRVAVAAGSLLDGVLDVGR